MPTPRSATWCVSWPTSCWPTTTSWWPTRPPPLEAMRAPESILLRDLPAEDPATPACCSLSASSTGANVFGSEAPRKNAVIADSPNQVRVVDDARNPKASTPDLQVDVTDLDTRPDGHIVGGGASESRLVGH